MPRTPKSHSHKESPTDNSAEPKGGPSQKRTLPPPTVKSSDKPISRYASNVMFDNNFWNARLIFGELMSEGDKPVIEQHTTITLPWVQAKILAGYLWLNVFSHERLHGEIKVPEAFYPSLPTAPPGTPKEEVELVRERIEQVREFLGEKQP